MSGILSFSFLFSRSFIFISFQSSSNIEQCVSSAMYWSLICHLMNFASPFYDSLVWFGGTNPVTNKWYSQMRDATNKYAGDYTLIFSIFFCKFSSLSFSFFLILHSVFYAIDDSKYWFRLNKIASVKGSSVENGQDSGVSQKLWHIHAGTKTDTCFFFCLFLFCFVFVFFFPLPTFFRQHSSLQN